MGDGESALVFVVGVADLRDGVLDFRGDGLFDGLDVGLEGVVESFFGVARLALEGDGMGVGRGGEVVVV